MLSRPRGAVVNVMRKKNKSNRINRHVQIPAKR